MSARRRRRARRHAVAATRGSASTSSCPEPDAQPARLGRDARRRRPRIALSRGSAGGVSESVIRHGWTASPTRPLGGCAAVDDRPPSSSTTVAPPSRRRRLAEQDVRAGEARDEAVGGRLRQLLRRAELAQRPVDQHADAVRERGGVAEVVGHEQRREVELGEQVLQLAADHGARLRVERGQRLVEQQHRRVARQRARERDPLALAAGDRRRAGPPRGARRRTARAARRPAPARRTRRSPHGQMREERVVLEHEADRALLGVERDPGARCRTTTSSPSAIRPASGSAQPGDRPQHRRLARRPDGPTSAIVSRPTSSATLSA